MARYPVLETQIVMPCYVIGDVSRPMSTVMLELQQVLEGLTNDANNDPILDDYRRLSIVTFGGAAKTLVPLFRPSEAQIPQLTTIGGGTNFGAAFEKYHRAFEADMAGLTAEGTHRYRPRFFFLSDGEPADSEYLEVFRSLLAYNPATKSGNRKFPFVLTFGFRDATVEAMGKLSYHNFGPVRGKRFVGFPNVEEIVRSEFSAPFRAKVTPQIGPGIRSDRE